MSEERWITRVTSQLTHNPISGEPMLIWSWVDQDGIPHMGDYLPRVKIKNEVPKMKAKLELTLDQVKKALITHLGRDGIIIEKEQDITFHISENALDRVEIQITVGGQSHSQFR